MTTKNPTDKPVVFAHDVVLRKGLEQWIQNWRRYAAQHPQDAGIQADHQWREEEYKKMVAILEERGHLPQSITCPRCQHTSYNDADIRNQYCGFCHEFHFNMKL